MTKLRQRMLEDLRVRNHAPGTQKAYIRSVAKFAMHYRKCPTQLGIEEIRGHQVYLVEQRKVGWATLNIVVCGLVSSTERRCVCPGLGHPPHPVRQA